ncbi:MAG: phosphoribosyltransferase [Cyclobacteriaceae bacterium]|nr:phosphoribosyltransferase [Cyclobacteriaceae bacterium]MCH8517359.1 phosphoribosyltransferase [Cyclobacteriaceae bacterium]
MEKAKIILNRSQILNKARRIAFEIIENNFTESALVLIGIKGNGLRLAKAIFKIIEKESDLKIFLLEAHPSQKNAANAEIIFHTADNNGIANHLSMVIVDDVLNTGSTMMAVINQCLKYHPKKIEVAVLVNRQHIVYPIAVKYTGLALATTLQDHIEVKLEDDHEVALIH